MEDLPTDEERKNSSVVAAALGVPPNSFVPNHGLSLKMNHEFSLSDLPNELSAVLRDYDVDNSGSVSVAELVAGAQLMRQQAKKNKLMTKIVIALTVLLLLLLAGNFGLVWAVVVYNTPTFLSSNVLTAKASGDPVQVSSADFHYDSNGLLQLRNHASQLPMDWVGSPAASCSSDNTSATGSTGRRRLLQDSGTTGGAINSTPTTVDMQTTQFTPTCNFSSPDFYTNSSFFFTGTCTFTKLVQMRTVVLPMLSSKTSAQVGGSIIDAAAWMGGAQTVYKGCYNADSTTPSSNWNQNVLSTSTSLANCETLAVNGDASSRPYNYFGFTGSATSTTGICYACSAASASCTPFRYGSAACSNAFGIRVFQVQRSPNRYQISGPGAMANSPIPIPGGSPAAPAWSYVTLAINRVDYVKNVFRDASNTLTSCQANLLRFYVAPMTASGTVTSVSGGDSSYIDVCLTPMSKAAPFGTGSTTWIGNYTAHSTGKSSTFVTATSAPAYYDRPSVTGFATPSDTDFQSVLSYFCLNCPSGPYIDYSNLQYDAGLFELPCTKKGISWRYRDVYSNQGCPAWDPSNPSAQSNCTWTTAESSNYGGSLGPKYCILTMDAFTPDEPVYTFDNQLSFLANTGRSVPGVQKTQTAFGDSGVPPLYNYSTASTFGPLWQDYFNTLDAATAAVSGTSWFVSNNAQSQSIVASGSRRKLLAPTLSAASTFYDKNSNAFTYFYIGDCLNKDGSKLNGWLPVNRTSTKPCQSGSTSKTNSGFFSPCMGLSDGFKNIGLDNAAICKCGAVSYCTSNAPVCRASATGTLEAGCFTYSPTQGTVVGSSSILAG